MNWTSVRTMRWVLAGVGVTAGVVLLYAGATLIGVVLLVMGGLRLAMLTMLERQGRAAGGAGGRRATGASSGPGGVRRELLERTAVAAGNLAPNRAHRLRAALPRWAARFVTETPAASAGVRS